MKHPARRHILVDLAAFSAGGFLVDLVHKFSVRSLIAAVVLIVILVVMDRFNIEEESDANTKS